MVVLSLLSLVLLAGQLVHAGDLLARADQAGCSLWWPALRDAWIALSEASLPLSALVTATLAMGAARRAGLPLVWLSLGRHPAALVAPGALVGLVLGGLAWTLAPTALPGALNRLGGTLTRAAICGLGEGGPRRLPGGGVLAPGGFEGSGLLMALPAGPGEAARVLWAREVKATEAQQMQLEDVALWAPGWRARVGQVRMPLGGGALDRRLKMAGPPNSLASAALTSGDPHHEFVRWRRRAQPALGPLWGVLGALLGLCLGAGRGLIAGVALAALAYEVLRAGELAARAGHWSPVAAAWGPAVALALVAGGLLWWLCARPRTLDT